MKKQQATSVTLFDKSSSLISQIHHEGDMVSLTDLWKQAGANKDKTPNDWLNIDASIQLVEAVSSMLNTVQNGKFDTQVVRTKRGAQSNGGGTWAHKQIALAYAKYLDPKLHVLVNEVFFQRVEEENNPDLIVDRAIATYQRKGKSADWISKRLEGKGKRNEFTACLSAHGVKNEGFKNCTNAIYNPLYGGTAAVVREKKHLPEKVNLRDHMSEIELEAVKFAESLSKQAIEKNSLSGNAQCEMACTRSAKIVANAVVQALKVA